MLPHKAEDCLAIAADETRPHTGDPREIAKIGRGEPDDFGHRFIRQNGDFGHGAVSSDLPPPGMQRLQKTGRLKPIFQGCERGGLRRPHPQRHVGYLLAHGVLHHGREVGGQARRVGNQSAIQVLQVAVVANIDRGSGMNERG